MMMYDLTNLASTDFEYLCNDLIAAELQVHVENFTEGRDTGIDGRFFTSNGEKCIIQAKHYARTGFSGLKSKIIEQVPKIQALGNIKYFLFTSVSLTPKKKDELISASCHCILSTNNIFGLDDINALLKRHENVVKKYYQLWLPQSPIFEIILKKISTHDIFFYTSTIIEEARKKATYYHKTSDYNKAYNILNKNKILLIHGIPGVGKTVLAQQLFLEYIANDYFPVAIQDNVRDFYKMFEEDVKQIFYFDDCWGSNFTSALSGNKDEYIIKIIEKINNSNNKRLILTSRTNIHDEVFQRTEHCYSKTLKSREYTIKLEDFSLNEKANILYYFLWKSEIDVDYLTIIIKNRLYDSIIRHKHYNPRLLEHITKKDYIQANSPEDYQEYIKDCLNDPKLVFEKAYIGQLTQLSRAILDLIVLSGGNILEDTLVSAFELWKKNNQFVTSDYPIDFNFTVKGMLRSFVTRTQNKHNVTYNVFNPSIADMIINKYLTSTTHEYIKYLCCFEKSEGLNFLASLSKQNAEFSIKVIKEYCSRNTKFLIYNDSQFEGFINCINLLSISEKIEIFSKELFILLEQKQLLSSYDSFSHHLLTVYLELSDYYDSPAYSKNCFMIKILKITKTIDELEIITDYYQNTIDRDSLEKSENNEELIAIFHETLLQIWQEYLDEFLKDNVNECIIESGGGGYYNEQYDEYYEDDIYSVDEDKLINLILKDSDNLYVGLEHDDVTLLLEDINLEDYIDRGNFDDYENDRKGNSFSSGNSYNENLFIDLPENKYR